MKRPTGWSEEPESAKLGQPPGFLGVSGAAPLKPLVLASVRQRMNFAEVNKRTTAKRLREQATRVRRLAKQIPGDPGEKRLYDLADELDARAESLDGEPAKPAGEE